MPVPTYFFVLLAKVLGIDLCTFACWIEFKDFSCFRLEQLMWMNDIWTCDLFTLSCDNERARFFPFRALKIKNVKSVHNFYLLIKTAFFYPSDLVNTKTTIPLRVGEERWIYTSTLRVSVYIHHYSPPLRGIVVYYLLIRLKFSH